MRRCGKRYCTQRQLKATADFARRYTDKDKRRLGVSPAAFLFVAWMAIDKQIPPLRY